MLGSFLCLLWALALPALAQDDPDDKTYLEALLQDALSGDDHTVTITGFQGALSSQAQLDRLTIADADGIWLTMQGATLIWSRSALLSGFLDVTELSAAEIEITRLPSGNGEALSVSDAQASTFALPDLPVSVSIEKLAIDKVILREAVIGEPATLTALGALTLNEGEGDASLEVQRLDRNDKISFAGGFSNATRQLSLDLGFDESSGGLVSSLLRIPGAPALTMTVTGDAPISDYTARMTLTSDGARRFGGTFQMSALSDEAELGYAFGANLSGDVRPLFAADLHRFFGENSALDVSGSVFADGRLLLDQLDISSGALNVSSEMALSPQGWPERFGIYGEILSDAPVRLPLTGPATTVGSAEFAATYNVAQGETWTTTTEIYGLERDGLTVSSAQISGQGSIGTRPLRQVTANLTFDALGIDHTNTGLAQALGQAAQGQVTLDWQPDTPLDIRNLLMVSGGSTLRARATVDGLSEGFLTQGEATLITNDLGRFQQLANRRISGTAEALLTGQVALLGGAFDAQVRAVTRNLQMDEPRLDPVLQGVSTLQIDAARTPEGTVLRQLDVQNDAVTATASGRLDATAGSLELVAKLRDVALVEPRLSGPADIDSVFSWIDGTGVSIARFDASLAGATLNASGTIDPANPALPVDGKITLSTPSLVQFAKVVGMPISGAADLSVQGKGQAANGIWDVEGAFEGTGVRSGLPELDRFLAGSVEALFSGAIGDDAPDLRYLRLISPRLRVNASGDGPGAPIALTGRLSDLALLAPGFPGPVTARGTVNLRDPDGKQALVALDATGPGGTTARITGDVLDYAKRVALDVVGTAPLGLANRFIEPRSVQGQAQFDLRIDGPPQLSSVSGTAGFENARAALPNLNYSLNNLNGTAQLSQGRAEVSVTGNAGTGGQFQVTGPVTLTKGFPGTLTVQLSQLGLFDPTLYQTTVSGTLDVTGALAGGARIAGTLALGPTLLRVPSGSGAITGTLPDIKHLYEPTAVRQTRKRAGLVETLKAASVAYPIDIVINAPNRIFVRGRGLDAELGGSVRVTGTTADMRPAGVFELVRGRLDILGKRLDLTEGLIDLRGALDPFLRFVAETSSDDVTILVILEGLASAPEVTFQSLPDLPQEEVVARLLFGRDLASMSAFQAAQLVSAVATLSGRYQGGITGRLRDSLGLSDLDITTTDDGATQFTAGAYISDNVYSEVVADSDGNQEINLNLDVSKYVTLKGRVNNEGNTGIGVFFEKDY
ncbi:MAG: translocation/assembly module TamB domain-containing protein [Roseovarius sp.]